MCVYDCSRLLVGDVAGPGHQQTSTRCGELVKSAGHWLRCELWGSRVASAGSAGLPRLGRLAIPVRLRAWWLIPPEKERWRE